MSKTLAEMIETLEPALNDIWPLEMRQGDAMQWESPHAKQMVNSNVSWLVTQSHRTAHKLYREIEALNQMPDVIRQLSADITALREALERPEQMADADLMFCISNGCDDFQHIPRHQVREIALRTCRLIASRNQAILAATDPNRVLE